MATLDLSTSIKVSDGITTKEVLQHVKNQLQNLSGVKKRYTIVRESDTELHIKSKFFNIPAFEVTFMTKQKENTIKFSINGTQKAGAMWHIAFWIIGPLTGGLVSIGFLIFLFVLKPLEKFRQVFSSVESHFEVM